ncbi:MAG TPA: helix-turn-helix transcriptional regulator, partial [Roseiarcus sp.]
MPDLSFNNPGKRNLDINIERNPVDVHVGSRVRSRRISAGISEAEFRAALGVSAEQMRAYESGETRIG